MYLRSEKKPKRLYIIGSSGIIEMNRSDRKLEIYRFPSCLVIQKCARTVSTYFYEIDWRVRKKLKTLHTCFRIRVHIPRFLFYFKSAGRQKTFHPLGKIPWPCQKRRMQKILPVQKQSLMGKVALSFFIGERRCL
jgi:hypothetical protein